MYPNLKLQLWKCGMRQNRLAKILDMDETALSRIVNGFRDPSVELQNGIAAVLQCSAAWLFQRPVEGAESSAESNGADLSVSDAPAAKTVASAKS